ncbi:hypothetical protein BD779DRAFT_1563649 [Infundibulicybe gibba]|nr:hypothetical protein BD779DRAFT_1563649 [Infundibulicybe gibba]
MLKISGGIRSIGAGDFPRVRVRICRWPHNIPFILAHTAGATIVPPGEYLNAPNCEFLLQTNWGGNEAGKAMCPDLVRMGIRMYCVV